MSSLVSTLNALLNALHLPITIDTPADLTPSLLLAILESLLRTRLPIPPALRTNADKVDAMKILLGVLETDVLRTDVGLSHLDPRRLARGEWHEVVYVGELLCWLARKKGMISRMQAASGSAGKEDEAPVDAVRRRSPSTLSTTTTSLHTDLSMHSVETRSSETSVRSMTGSNATTQTTQPPPLEIRPRCIHEIEEPSLLHLSSPTPAEHFLPQANESVDSVSTAYCDCSLDYSTTTESPPRVRHTGWLHPVDTTLELASFEASKSSCRSHHAPTKEDRSEIVLTRYTSPARYRLALLEERARLLEELARVEVDGDC